MTKPELFELMREAGFNVDWTSHPDVKEILAKYERFAELIELKVKASQEPHQHWH